jgi:hypothetical protein
MALEVRKYVHVFMGDTDDVYTIVAAQIKHNVLAFWKTIIPLSNISSMPTMSGTLGQPVKTILQIFQVCIPLGLALMLLSIATDRFQVFLGPWCNSVFCHQASLSRSLISASIEKSSTKSPVRACCAPWAK